MIREMTTREQRLQLVSEIVAETDYDQWKNLFLEGHWEDEPSILEEIMNVYDEIVLEWLDKI